MHMVHCMPVNTLGLRSGDYCWGHWRAHQYIQPNKSTNNPELQKRCLQYILPNKSINKSINQSINQ